MSLFSLSRWHPRVQTSERAPVTSLDGADDMASVRMVCVCECLLACLLACVRACVCVCACLCACAWCACMCMYLCGFEYWHVASDLRSLKKSIHETGTKK